MRRIQAISLVDLAKICVPTGLRAGSRFGRKSRPSASLRLRSIVETPRPRNDPLVLCHRRGNEPGLMPGRRRMRDHCRIPLDRSSRRRTATYARAVLRPFARGVRMVQRWFGQRSRCLGRTEWHLSIVRPQIYGPDKIKSTSNPSNWLRIMRRRTQGQHLLRFDRAKSNNFSAPFVDLHWQPRLACRI